MSPTIKRIESDERLPASADVVVIGGGIIGVTAAYFLAKAGHSVAVVEKGYVGCEQSSRNWGWCRQQNRDAREMPLAKIAMRRWEEMTKDIGADLGFRRCGLVYATDDAKLLEDWASWRGVAREFNVNTRMLSAAEANEKIRAPGRTWLGGVHSMDDGKAEPALAAPTIAEGARALGATIHQECAARGLDIANNRIIGVITEKGVIKTNRVLCAAGAWASAFCRHHGLIFPQASVLQTALRTGPAPDVGDVVYTEGCALTRRLDGSYTLAISGKAMLEITPQGIRYAKSFAPMFKKRLKALQFSVGKSFFSGPEAMNSWKNDGISPMEIIRVLDPAASPRAINTIMTRVKRLFPALANVAIQERWGSYVDCTPDAVPVVSPVDGLDGFFLAAGCSGHGFGLGPGLANLAADLVVGNDPCVDPKPFRLSRLLDGSRIQVGSL